MWTHLIDCEFLVKMTVFVLIFLLSVLLDQGVSDAGSDRVKKLVKEGDSVTLHTGVEVNKENRATWYFYNVRIAYIDRDLKICTDDECPERFRDRLNLNHQTGSLTITDTRTTDSGEYKLKISSIEMIFSVTVTGVFGDEVVTVKEGDNVTLNTDVTKQHDDIVLWYFNDTLIANIDGDPSTSCLYVVPDGRFRDRLEVDYKTGSLIITNITTQHAGHYEAEYDKENEANKIETLNRPGNEKRCEKAKDTKKGDLGKIIKSYSLTVSGSGLSPAVPGSGLSPGVVAGIAVVLLLAVGVGVMIFRCRSSRIDMKKIKLESIEESSLQNGKA